MVSVTINGVDVNVNVNSGAVITDDPSTRYLLVTLDSRMSNELYQSLLKEGMSMNHHAGNNVYVCTRITKQSLEPVKGLSFVHGLAVYPINVAIESKLQRLKSDPAKASEIVNLNVRLHGESQESAKDIFPHTSGASKSAALLAANRQVLDLQHVLGSTKRKYRRHSGGYTTDAKNVDDSMYNSPELLVILAAGNDARTHTASQAQIGGHGASKNGLVVGSCSNNRPWDPKKSGALTDTQYSTAQGSVQYLNYIPTCSNRGSSKLGHLKPDLVTPGLPVLSIRSSNYSDSGVYGTVDDTRLAFMTGTSMSAPLVAGYAAILREAAKKTKSVATVSGPLIKALLINGAVDLAGDSTGVTCVRTDDKTKVELVTFPLTAAPNVCQGYGMLNVARSLASVVQSNSTTQGCLDFTGLKTDALLLVPVVVPAGKYQINVTLAYNDLGSTSLENIVNLTLKFNETSLGTTVPLVPTKMGFEDRRETQPAAYSRNTLQKVSWQQPSNRTTETKANINVSVSKLYAKQESIDFGIAYSTVKLD